MSEIRIEELTSKLLPAVTEIFNHYIVHSTASFHIKPLTVVEMAVKRSLGNPHYNSFAIFCDDELVGYSAIFPWKGPEAYDATAEVSVYLKPEMTGLGIGNKALAHLEIVAANRGLKNLVAGICTENTESIKLFERNGYLPVAHFKGIGYKFGRDLDVIYLQKKLRSDL